MNSQQLLKLEQTIFQQRFIRHAYIEQKASEELILIADAQLFLLLQQYDIGLMLSHFNIAETEMQKIYSARLFALTVYEFNQTVPVLLGKKFRDKLEKYANISLTELDGITSRISDLKKNNKHLKEIRNVAIAHREHNAIKQIELMERMASMNYAWLVAFVFDIATDLLEYLISINDKLLEERRLTQSL